MEKELPVRKKLRLERYDYSSAGAYFITFCVKDGHEMLGQIVGDAHPGVPQILQENVPCIDLNETGKMVSQYIDNIPLHYDNVKIDKYVVMPNHIHMIVILEHGTNPVILEHGTPGCASPTKSKLAKVINAFKSLTSRRFGESMWQRGSHDHIIRDEADYQRIWQYIDKNPAKWAEDEYYK